MRRSWIGRVLLAPLGALPLAAAGAQTLSDQVAGLFKFGSCDQPLCLSVNADLHGSHYVGAAVTANAQLLSFLTNAINVSVSSIPISATSGGSTFRFVGGAPVRSTVSAGPIFAERAQTLGRGRFLLGANTTGISFSTVRGVDLDDIALNFAHVDVGIRIEAVSALRAIVTPATTRALEAALDDPDDAVVAHAREVLERHREASTPG